jgi:two-component system OmpR family sensor kinase
VAHLFFSYGGKAPTPPVIPPGVAGQATAGAADYYFSTSSTGPDAIPYRAVAKTLLGGTGTIIVAIPLTDLNDTLRQLLLIEVFVSAAVLLGLAVLSWVMIRRDLRPLNEITRTANVIARGDLSQRVSAGPEGSEVGQLGRAFNTMVDEIEVAFAERAASEERLRRFLADASHELRTPLTSILGYTELFDLGVRDRPDDLALSMRNIKGEASRMGALVDDLFLLAQLDRQRPFRIEAVDLAELVRRSADGIGASAPSRHVTVDAPDPVVVEADEHRMRQVIDNLLVNAVDHSPDTAPIDVRVSRVGDSALLTVHDGGPGIAPGDADRIFEPFYRADPSRARSSGGAGLGLAIVAAIVAAHGGTVSVLPAGEPATVTAGEPATGTAGEPATGTAGEPASEPATGAERENGRLSADPTGASDRTEVQHGATFEVWLPVSHPDGAPSAPVSAPTR